jgi:hypothetical protein
VRIHKSVRMFRRLKSLVGCILLTGTVAVAQSYAPVMDHPSGNSMPDFSFQKPLPILAPELALQAFLKERTEQNARLASYHDETTVTAELPDTQQRGEYQLERGYTAQPRSLTFGNAHFTGDGFVKTNVITRLLQSEVEHVEKGEQTDSSVDFTNYKFYYKGMENVGGHDMHVFQVKPRRKAPGLFKGRMFLDVHTAALRRMEGTLAKSPSFFVKNLQFVQDFDTIEGITVPTVLHSSAKARIIGRAIVDVVHRAYRVQLATPPAITTSVQAMP